MSNLTSLLFGLASAEVKSSFRRARMLASFYVLATLLGSFGVLALLVSAGFAMARHMSPEAAALSIAGILFALSLIVLAASSIWSVRGRNERASKSAKRAIATAAAVSLLPALISNRMGLGLIAAVVTGYALANRKSPGSVVNK
mgnify:FL=1